MITGNSRQGGSARREAEKLSTAQVEAANTVLLARMGQIGEGSSLAGKRLA